MYSMSEITAVFGIKLFWLKIVSLDDLLCSPIHFQMLNSYCRYCVRSKKIILNVYIKQQSSIGKACQDQLFYLCKRERRDRSAVYIIDGIVHQKIR